MPQKHLHQRIVYPTITKIFAIVLQYNSKVRIVLLQYSKKKLYILFTFSSKISLSSISLFQFSSFTVSPSALSSLQTQTPFFLPCGCFFFFFWRGWRRGSVAVVGFGVGHYGGCGFFFWLWPVLKGVVGRGWVRCLGCWSWLGSVFESWLGCGSGVWVVGDGVGQ